MLTHTFNRSARAFSSSASRSTNGGGMMGGSPKNQQEKNNMYLALGGLAAVGAGLLYYVNREDKLKKT